MSEVLFLPSLPFNIRGTLAYSDQGKKKYSFVILKVKKTTDDSLSKKKKSSEETLLAIFIFLKSYLSPL